MTALDDVAAATGRLLATCRKLTDADLAEPSLLPGWSRGHVLTHIARNADSLVNLLTWARTGVETPQYVSNEVRDADIEAGAPRPIAEQIADLESSAERFHAAAGSLPPEALDAVVRKRSGAEVIARTLPWDRLREVEIHHVDAAAGYTSANWPAEFVARLLPEAVADFAGRDGVPPLRLVAPGFEATIGAGEPGATVTGEAHALVAWLIGRSDGADLAVSPPGPLPTLPAWR